MIKDRRHAWSAFRSSATMEKIPVTPEDAAFIVAEIRSKFPRRRFRPRIEFISKRGSWGRLGDANIGKQRIRLYKNGHNLETLLHEIAHLLAPPDSRRSHDKDFYFTCDLLEKELF